MKKKSQPLSYMQEKKETQTIYIHLEIEKREWKPKEKYYKKKSINDTKGLSRSLG